MSDSEEDNSAELPAIEPNPITVPSNFNRANYLDRANFLKDLEHFLGAEFQRKDLAFNVPIFIINRARILDSVLFIKNRQYFLETMFASDFIKYFEVNYVFHCRPFIESSQLIIQTQIDKSIKVPSIQDIYPNAHYLELNLSHRLGMEFHRESKLMGSAENSLLDENETPVLCLPLSITVTSSPKNNTALGIFNPIHTTKDYIDGYIEDGLIRKIELRDGWLYKKAQPNLELRNPFHEFESIFETLTETSIVHLNLAYLLNFEYLTKKLLPNKVKYLRTLFAELERIRSHLLWFINLADLLSFNSIYVTLCKFFQEFSEHMSRYFLSGGLKNVIKYGTAIDISSNNARHLLKFLRTFGKKVFNACYDLVYKSFTVEKCSEIGIISKENALDWGLTGPALRGCGIPVDVRYTDPYLVYNTGEVSQVWNVISFNGGDVFARTQVRLWEIRESIEICINIVQGFETYDEMLKNEPLPTETLLEPDKQMFHAVESPQGALSVYIRTDPDKKVGKKRLYTVRISTPDQANYAALEKHLLLYEPPHAVPLILHSLDLNFQMIDL